VFRRFNLTAPSIAEIRRQVCKDMPTVNSNSKRAPPAVSAALELSE
jgi:hypothetical protein